MPRINIKGGVWRNTEDEILKAAVMKYGKNQWARIASLLHRKAAKQCKARWYEWLDPSVKKTEWSREEDEKLLHLAKLMPTQWRTIAPIVGRTSNQCLERYEFLLDKAQSIDSSSNRDDPRRLRPGEIDPSPETKPARPDPIDMDEDELEMLSEARARLANTQGKKAKRKARERQLDIARRMAMMQKRRELRAAGLPSTTTMFTKKKPYIDYNSEIPFERQPPKGFHDTSSELAMPKEFDFDRLRLSDVEKETYMEREKRERKKDADRQAKKLESDLPAALLGRDRGLEEPAIKRSKLVLPAPQISDVELENLVKVGQAGENAMRVALEDGRGDATGNATQPLLSDYQRGSLCSLDSAFDTPAHLLAKTPMSTTDNLMQDAQTLLALQLVQTPLKGGENPTLPGGTLEMSGITSKLGGSSLVTPNLLLPGQLGATPFRTPSASGFGATPTPGVPNGPGVTPRRDHLNINTADGVEGAVDARSNVASLRKALSKLPQPKNNFEICMPDDEDGNEAGAAGRRPEEDVDLDATDKQGTAAHIPDQADLDHIDAESRAAMADAEWAERSASLRRGLPRPTVVNHSILRPPPQPSEPLLTDLQRAEEMVKAEMLCMMHYDNANNPPEPLLFDLTRNIEGKLVSVQAQRKKLQQLNVIHETYLRQTPYERADPEALKDAAELLQVEIESVRTAMGHGELSIEAYSKVWQECLSQVLYLPQHRRYTRANLASKRDRIESLEKCLEQLRSLMKEEDRKAAKLEKKLRVVLGGYQSRAQTLIKAMQEAIDQTEQSMMEYSTFVRLREQEIGAIVRRRETLQTDVDRQQAREVELQREFARLVRIKEEREADFILLQRIPYSTPANPATTVEMMESEDTNDRGGWTTIQYGDDTSAAQKDPSAGAATSNAESGVSDSPPYIARPPSLPVMSH